MLDHFWLLSSLLFPTCQELVDASPSAPAFTPCCVHAGKTIAPVAPVCLQQLAAQLLAVAKNPTQPGFNHYLFESVAALIRWVGVIELLGRGVLGLCGTVLRCLIAGASECAL